MDFADKAEIVKLFYLYGEEIYENTETNKKLTKKIGEKREKLFNSLTEEQKTEFEKIDELTAQNYEETDKNIFVTGFTTAVKLIIQSLK